MSKGKMQAGLVVGIWLVAILGLGIAANMVFSGENQASVETPAEQPKSDVAVFNPPSVDDLDPDDPMTPYIEYGEEIFGETNTVLPDHVGNELSCASCHANGGLAQTNSMVGVAPNFPEFNGRAGTTFTLEDRINGCMVRSMNGEMIDNDSREMRSLMAWLTYISEGIEVGQEVPWRQPSFMNEIPEPSVASGEELYQNNCMSCHATDGSGTGANTGPAVWGENSFNDGAGMARMTKMAGYLQDNMPPNDPTLTDQEAADLAAFILSHDRPVYDGHDDDWPNGAPSDIITEERRKAIQEGTFDWTEIDAVIPAE